MLTFPETVPEAVAKRLNRIIAALELACVEAAATPPPIKATGDGGYIYLGETSGMLAIRGAVTSIAAIVEQLPDQTRKTIDELIDQVLTLFHRYKRLDCPFEAFCDRVLTDVHIAPAWRAFVSPRIAAKRRPDDIGCLDRRSADTTADGPSTSSPNKWSSIGPR